MADETDVATGMALRIRRTFHRTFIPRCPSCHAPGRYSCHPSIKEGWPGCYVEANDSRDGTDIVDGNCPNCGSARPPVEELPVMEFTE